MHQAAMRSPHTSPSLRSIAHMHNRASYFPSPPSSPGPIASPVVQQHQHQHQTYPVTSSPLASPRMASPRPTDTARPTPSRRATFTSAIPIGYNVHPHPHPHCHSPSLPSPTLYQTQNPTSPKPPYRQHAQSLGDTRRRPSFKIDLPPRPAPSEILAVEDDVESGYQGHTPYAPPSSGVRRPSLTRDEVGAGRKLSLGPLEMTDMRGEIDNIAYSSFMPTVAEPGPFPIATYNGKPPPSAPTFRDPFASVAPRSSAHPQQQEESYVIIRAPTRRLEEARERSSMWRENDPFAGAVGLGYSLNRLRAPTPWVRKTGEEGEWLSAEDVAGL
jgi:hypothetical protein